MFHVEDLERVKAAIAAAIDPAGTGEYKIEYRVLPPGKTMRWLSIRGQSFFRGHFPTAASRRDLSGPC